MILQFHSSTLRKSIALPILALLMATSPVTAQIVINEIDYDQAGTDTDEFVELKNTGLVAENLDFYTLELVNGTGNGAAVYDTIDLPNVSLAAGDYYVICANAATVANCDLDDGPDTNFIQNGGPDAVGLRLSGSLVDTVSYEGDTGAPYTEGSGTGLVDDFAATDSGLSRCADGIDTDQNNVDFTSAAISPGASNDCTVPPAGGDVVINEVMQNPSAVSDTNGEWFELVNTSSDPVDIDGWMILDNGSDSHVIVNSGPLVIPAGGFLVLGRNADAGANGGVAIDYEYSGIFLANGSDELVLLDTASSEVDRVEWDNGATFPDPTGASMALKSPALDNNAGANWCESQTPFGDGDLGTPGAPNDCLARLVINEVDADDTSGDDEEFIELYDGGVGGTDLTGLVVVLYNGSDDASYNAFDLDGFLTDGDGFFVICGNAANVPNCDLDVLPDTNLIQNGADAVALHAGDAADFPNDTPVTTAGLLDALVYDTNDADDAGLLVLLNATQPQVNEGGGGDKDLHSNQRCPNGFGGQRNTDAYFQDTPTAGALNNCPPFEIFEIQGAGLASVYEGFIVGTDADVVTAVAPDGFFMQTPSAGSDGDVDTSDGIFVFTGGAPGVVVGDLVDVEGEISEFFGFTEFGFGSTITVVGTGTVPPPVAFNATVPSPDPIAPSCSIEYECYEGMLVEITDGTVTGPNQRFGVDPIAEVHITAASARTFREPGVEFPGLSMPPIPDWDGNPEVFELDPDKLGLANQTIPAGSSFSATGVIGFEFGGYELWPTSLSFTPAPLPVPVRPREPGELTVGTLNVFRLFDDIDDPVDPDGRNDAVVSTAEYERRLAKFSAYIRDVLGAPDILAVQEVESLTVLGDLADQIEIDDPSVIYVPHLIEGNDIGTIDNGFLTRARIVVDAVSQVDPDTTFIDPTDGSVDILHDRPPLLLEGSCDLQFGTFPIAVMSVHNRSLGGIEDLVDGPRVRFKRLSQAESIATKVQDLQTADPNVRLVVTGDFNAFEFTDGYVDVLSVIEGDFDPATSFVCTEASCLGDLVEPNLDNQVLEVPAEDRYSFIFRGSAQVLDHALTSQKLAGEIGGVEYGRGNADAAVDLINDDGSVDAANLPLRASDHDGLVLYIAKDEDADGVPNDGDVCPATVLPEGVPTQSLGTNRFADTDGDGVFNTTPPKGKGPKRHFDIGDTAGCSCEQIIEAQGLGNGHTKFGCSIGAMENWIDLVTP